jgi:uncharacterized protein YbjT (DUF2867 family)
MRVAVAGGTGVVGRHVVSALRSSGHDVEVLSRSAGVDVRAGDGLAESLTTVDVVIDTLNSPSIRGKAATEFFTTTSRRLQELGAAAGVQHIVTLSIVGVDRVHGYPYYEAKLAQERAATAGDVPATVLRATQFHEFPAQIMSYIRLGRLAVVPHMRSQPVAARTVGDHLARLAAERPGGVVELAGPEVHDITDLARRFVAARQLRTHVLGVSLPGKAARDMRGDALLAGPATAIDGPAFDEWLASDDAKQPALLGQGSA